MSEPDLDRAAEALCRHRLTATPVTPLPAALRPRDEAEGYAVQARLHDRFAAAGRGEVVGYKIGCTTAVMQELLGIDWPCAGGVCAGTVAENAAKIFREDYVRVGFEGEIAVELGRPLTAAGAPYNRDSVSRAVAACRAAIEVVDNRYDTIEQVGVPTLIADDFFGAACVLGPRVEDWRALDLAAVEGCLSIDGVPAVRGKGLEVMGHPLEALAWLANTRAALGLDLDAGRFVLLGSLIKVQWLEGDHRIDFDLTGLGRVSATLTSRG